MTGDLFMPACAHAVLTMVRLDCGAGGIQYRKYCTTCWHSLGGSIAHSKAHEEIERTGVTPPLADIEVIQRARNAYWRAR